jgi:hypothetical protein
MNPHMKNRVVREIRAKRWLSPWLDAAPGADGAAVWGMPTKFLAFDCREELCGRDVREWDFLIGVTGRHISLEMGMGDHEIRAVSL